MGKGKKPHIEKQRNKLLSPQPAQRVTHDLQGLLEDLLCTNLSETITSRILTLSFAQNRNKRSGSKRPIK